MGPVLHDAHDAQAVEPVYFPGSRPWKNVGAGLRLTGMACPACGLVTFPTQNICHGCGNRDDLAAAELAPEGTLYSFSEVHIAPRSFKTPFVIAYVDLDDGVRLLAQVAHPASELCIGERLRLVEGVIRTEDAGVPVVSYQFAKVVA